MAGYRNEIILIVAGDWGVGKSSFVRRYNDGTFTGEPITNTEEQAFSKILNINGAEVRLTIKDIVGEDFRSNMTTAQYRSCQGVLLMFDLTEPTSFNNLEGWFRDADRYKSASIGGELDYVLVGLKADLVDERKIAEDSAKKWAEMFHLPYVEASSKNNSHVNDTVQSLCERVHMRLSRNAPALNTSALSGGSSNSSVSTAGTPKIVGMSSARGGQPPKKKKTCTLL